MSPITWLPTAMHYSDNEDEFRFDCVEDSVGKHPCETAVDVFFDYSPALRPFSSLPDCVFYGIDESKGQRPFPAGRTGSPLDSPQALPDETHISWL